MATPIKQLPFLLMLEQSNRLQTVPAFYVEEEEVPEEEYVVLRENMDVKVLFQSAAAQCRLYMEGLEQVTDEADERGNLFLRPSQGSRLIYRHKDFPLIPGDYLIRIVLDGMNYCAMVRIIPKQMTEGQLQLMKNEIDAFLKGLGRDYVEVRDSLQLSGHFLKQAEIMQKHCKSVLPAAADLRERAVYELRKEYDLVPAERLKRTDQMTVQHYVRHPEQKEMFKSPVYRLNYDVPENRWLKKMTRSLRKTVLDLQEQCSRRHAPLAITEHLGKLQRALNLLASADWFAEVDEEAAAAVPHTMHLDARYRAVFQMYRELQQSGQGEERTKETRWKRTDKLYEIWGFIQFIQVLSKELGFQPVSGWVFSEAGQPSLADLIPNTRLEFIRDDLQLQLYYEGEIPLEYQEGQPLYMEGSNNRPDMRLDVFTQGLYLGSILFDFKYRPLHHIWEPQKLRSKIPVMRQLTNYAMLCRSHRLYGGAAHAHWIRPVHEVWAIHPNAHPNLEKIQHYRQHDIRIVHLSPGCELRHIAGSLQHMLEEMKEKCRQFIK